MLRRAIAASRYLIIIAVIGTFLASIGILVYDGVALVNIIVAWTAVFGVGAGASRLVTGSHLLHA